MWLSRLSPLQGSPRGRPTPTPDPTRHGEAGQSVRCRPGGSSPWEPASRRGWPSLTGGPGPPGTRSSRGFLPQCRRHRRPRSAVPQGSLEDAPPPAPPPAHFPSHRRPSTHIVQALLGVLPPLLGERGSQRWSSNPRGTPITPSPHHPLRAPPRPGSWAGGHVLLQAPGTVPSHRPAWPGQARVSLAGTPPGPQAYTWGFAEAGRSLGAWQLLLTGPTGPSPPALLSRGGRGEG